MHGMEIRLARPDDAAALIALHERLSTETDFVLYEPGERVLRAEEYSARIDAVAKAESGVTFVAETGGALVGVIFGNRGGARKTRHTLTLALGVLEAHWGRGVGGSLLRAVETWAASRKLHRLELTVHTANRRAVALYEKMGFEREGTKRHSLHIKGHYADEWLMAKLLRD